LLRLVEPVQVPVHPDERLLHQILRPVTVPDRPIDEVQQPDLVPPHQLAERPLLAREELRDQTAVVQFLQGLRPRPDLALRGSPHDVDHRFPQSGKRAVTSGPAASLGPTGHRVGGLGCRFRTMRPLAVRTPARFASYSGNASYDNDARPAAQTPCPLTWTRPARKWTLFSARRPARSSPRAAGCTRSWRP